jgi:chemotaxis protein CheZ
VSTDDVNPDDLEALFDSIAGTTTFAPPEPEPAPAAAPAAAAPAASAPASGDLFSQLGQATRQFHDALRDIGHDKISQLQAQADKARTAIGGVKPLQDALDSGSGQLSGKWQQLMDGKLSVEEFKGLVGETRAYLQDVPMKTKSCNSQLADASTIDPALLKKLADSVLQLEAKLLQALVANAPDAAKKAAGDVPSNANPDQVKTALSSLGF